MAKRTRRSKRCVCCLTSGIIITIIFIIFFIALTLVLTVYKPKQPITKIQSATVEGISTRLSVIPFDVHLNFTLNLDILVENRNRFCFKHGIGKTLVVYREKQVGDVDLPSGTFPAKGSTILPCLLTLQIDKFVGDISGIMQDVLNGKIVLETKTTIPGKVKLLGIFNKHLVALSDCQIITLVPSMKVQDQVCQTSTKL